MERMQQLTRQRQSAREDIDCDTLIREVHKLAEVEAQLRNFVIVLRLEDNLPKVHCDPVQIQQVILNLLRNGMEAMESSTSRDSKIVLTAEQSDNRIRICIIDSGPGISESLGHQLYRPFTSTKSSGMGLGLSISRSIIADHGGQLEFANNRQGGATFHFSLPISRKSS